MLVTRCWLISVPRSSVAHLYSLLAAQLLLLTARHSPQFLWYFGLLAHQHTVLLVSCCSLSAIHLASRQLFSLKILLLAVRCTMLPVRFSLYAIDNLLLTATSLLFARRLLLGSCFSLVGPLLSGCSPLTNHRTFAQCLPHANRFTF